MYCVKCGKQIDDTAQFCKYCGAPTHLNKDESQSQPGSLEKTEILDPFMDSIGSTVNNNKPSESRLPIFLAIGLFIITIVMVFLSIVQNKPEGVIFVRWEDAGRQDHVMDWQDENLESAMRNITMINNRDIMLSDVWELTVLDLSSYMLNGGRIRNISALGELTNLTILYLSGNEINDISALRNLKNLTVLNLHGNQIQDISALRSLTNLTALYLGENRIREVRELSGLTNLTVLILCGNEISDVSSLGGWLRFGDTSKLEWLFTQICFLRQARGLIHLAALDLSYNQISSVSGLEKLNTLNYLYLSNNQIIDINALETLVNLSELNLSYNEISKISALENLVHLTTLNLAYNEISDVTALGNLTKLTILVLSSNRITDIYELRNLVNLISVYLVDNSLTNVNALNDLPYLSVLYWKENEPTGEEMAGTQWTGSQGMGTGLWKEETQSQTEQDQETKQEEKTTQKEDTKTTQKTEKSSEKTKDLLSNDYVIPDSNSRYLTSSELKKLSLKEINYAKNEIFARRGRKFQSKELQDYFNSKSWYKGKIKPDDFQWNTFNDYEKANAELLSKTEFERDPKGYLLDQ